ncbi:MAG: FtsQ-type POTRA domain-containing protein [Pseudomonadota bacterium]
MMKALKRLLRRDPDTRTSRTREQRQRQRQGERRARGTKVRAARRLIRRERTLKALIAFSRPLVYVALAAVVAILPVGLYRVILYAMGSPHFALMEIRCQGLNHLSEEDVATAAGLRLGTSIMAVDPDDVEHTLAREDWVRKVHVHRELPQTLVVEITERTPVAMLAAGDLYLLDDTATPFTRVGVREFSDLPVLSLSSVESIGLEDMRSIGLQEMLAEALALITEYGQTGLGDRFPLEEISIDPVEGYRIYSRGGQVTFVLGHGPFVQKWERLEVVLSDLDSRGAEVVTVRLDNDTHPWKVAVKAANLDLAGTDRRQVYPLRGAPRELLP